MFNKKVYGIMIIIALAAGISITTTRCYDDDKDARVTIHLERNDLANMGIQPEKRLIDRVLEFFSTPAYAVAGWDSTHGSLTLKVINESSEELTYSIPTGATTYTVEIPSGNNITLEVTSYTTGGAVSTNWGGHTTVNLGPGEQDITIYMIPMTIIIGAGGSTSLDVNWEPTSFVTIYNIYRSTSSSGPFALIGTDTVPPYNDTTALSGVTYYYRISIVNTSGEGIMCAPYAGSRI